VLIITCPCALGLAVPAVLTAVSGRLFRDGVLLKSGEALERLAGIDAVVLDKTGTLTTGAPVLTNAGDLPREALALAAALARDSAHPLARAIRRAAEAEGVRPVMVEAITEQPGLGTEGQVAGRRVRLGRAEWVGAGEPATTTATWLAVEGEEPLVFRFSDEPRPEAAGMVARFRAAGLPVTLLSGDTEAPVRALADRLGIEHWIAGATPAEKVAHLDKLRADGARVLMIGDGLNDAAALAAAHVSMSPASAVDASRSAADMILLGDGIGRAVDAWLLARRGRRRILENFALAFGYNVITVPIAYAGLVTPLIAAIAMSASSIVVSLNAMRLGRQT
jgi:P-type Cu2+ transporter